MGRPSRPPETDLEPRRQDAERAGTEGEASGPVPPPSPRDPVAIQRAPAAEADIGKHDVFSTTNTPRTPSPKRGPRLGVTVGISAAAGKERRSTDPARVLRAPRPLWAGLVEDATRRPAGVAGNRNHLAKGPWASPDPRPFDPPRARPTPLERQGTVSPPRRLRHSHVAHTHTPPHAGAHARSTRATPPRP